MYARQISDGRLARGVSVPRNYSGNAFRQSETEQANDEAERSEAAEISASSEELAREASLADAPSAFDSAHAEAVKDPPSAPAGHLLRSPGFRLDVSRFFKREHGLGLGFEELLIIGLILLISSGEQKDDLILLLLLLLFIE